MVQKGTDLGLYGTTHYSHNVPISFRDQALLLGIVTIDTKTACVLEHIVQFGENNPDQLERSPGTRGLFMPTKLTNDKSKETLVQIEIIRFKL